MADGGITELIGKVADAIKSLGVTTIAAAVAVVAAACLWLPDRRLASLHLLTFRNAHPDWVGPAFWIAAILLGLTGIVRVQKSLRGGQSVASIKRHFRKRLAHLTPKEKGLLYEFLANQTRTKELPSENPTVVSLTNAGILWRPTQMIGPRLDYNAPGGLTFPMMYQIHETVWQILKEQPDLLN
jgi:hypothetical protein